MNVSTLRFGRHSERRIRRCSAQNTFGRGLLLLPQFCCSRHEHEWFDLHPLLECCAARRPSPEVQRRAAYAVGFSVIVVWER
jgi:hypothetical protein